VASFGIGQAVRRVADRRFLMGRGRFIEDISLPHQCYGVVVQSPHAHARIRNVDVSEASRAPGLVCVLTGADAVAETVAQAQDAADLVKVEYEPLEAVVSPTEAARDTAPRVWNECPTGNLAWGLMFGSQEAADAAFAGAEHVVSLRLANTRLSANALEPRGALGEYDPASEQYTLYSSVQNPHGIRSEMAHVLGISQTRARVWNTLAGRA
jgi:aerobic carbon-monoxide dehydrogenase large subunit